MIRFLNQLAQVKSDFMQLLQVILVLSFQSFNERKEKENSSLETQIILAMRDRQSQKFSFHWENQINYLGVVSVFIQSLQLSFEVLENFGVGIFDWGSQMVVEEPR